MFGDVGLILWMAAFLYVVVRSEGKFRREHKSEHSQLVKEVRELKEEISVMKKALLDKEHNILLGLLDGTFIDGEKNNKEKEFEIKSVQSHRGR